jgi:hypothetical protein
MMQLKRVTDQVFNRRATDRVVDTIAAGYEQVRDQGGRVARKTYERGNEAAKQAYGYAMNHPKSTAAVVLGTALAAGLWWFIQRSGGYNAVRRQVLKSVRGAAERSRSRRRAPATTE